MGAGEKNRPGTVLMAMDKNQFQEALRVLRSGGLVIAPTETFYGIMAHARSGGAVERLLRIKGREPGKPIPVVAADVRSARAAAMDTPPLFEALSERFWPGPLTLVLKADTLLPAGVTAGTGTVGVRVPSPSIALDLARSFGSLLTATSANFPGQAPPATAEEVDPDLAAAADLVLDGGRTPGGLPSTVLDITVHPPVMVRGGALEGEVREFLARREPESRKEGPGSGEERGDP